MIFDTHAHYDDEQFDAFGNESRRCWDDRRCSSNRCILG